MARRCQICGRKPHPTIKRSHSHIASKRRQFLNLQTKVIDDRRKKICTRCLRTMSKPR